MSPICNGLINRKFPQPLSLDIVWEYATAIPLEAISIPEESKKNDSCPLPVSTIEVIIPSARSIPNIHTQSEIEPEFLKLAKQWREETCFMSSITIKSMHPAYQRIIGMGSQVAPLILRELKKKPEHWF